jgi:hypothetical protein
MRKTATSGPADPAAAKERVRTAGEQPLENSQAALLLIDDSPYLRGCTDGNCIIRKPVGMHTNGGCRCVKELQHAFRGQMDERRRFEGALRYRQQQVEELRGEITRLLTLLERGTAADNERTTP